MSCSRFHLAPSHHKETLSLFKRRTTTISFTALVPTMKLSRRSGSAAAAAAAAPFREIQNSHRDKGHHRIPPPIEGKRSLKLLHCVGKPFQAQGQRKRRVHFNHGYDRIYENKLRLDKLDCKALWYTPEEIRALHRQTKEQQHDIRISHPHYATWSNSLHSVYHSFCSINNAREVMTILDTVPRAFHPAGLGMERRAVSLVYEDTASRRRQIYANTARIQSAPVPDPWLRAQILREMSRSISKPSRLYARHVALLAAAA